MANKNLVKHSPIVTHELDDVDDKSAVVRRGLTLGMRYLNNPMVKDDEEAKERLEGFFTDCIELGMRPTVESMALCLGTTKATLWDWEVGRYGSRISPEIITKAKQLIAEYDAQMVLDGRMNPVTYIFRAKNYYGMKDQQEHILTPNTDMEKDAQTLIDEAELLPK